MGTKWGLTPGEKKGPESPGQGDVDRSGNGEEEEKILVGIP